LEFRFKNRSAGVLFTALCAVVLFSLFSCNLNFDFLGDFWRPSDTFHAGDYAALTKRTGVDFRILQFTDTHINAYYDGFAIEESFNMMRKAVQITGPDLIVLTGDNVGNFINSVWAWQLITFLDSLRVPYALVMGNHDGDFTIFNDDNQQHIVAEIFSKGKHSLFSMGPDNLSGTGNYGINIVDESGDIIHGLILMDSGDDYLRNDQIEWYDWYVRGLEASAGGLVQTSVFIHVPPCEVSLIKEEMKAYGLTDLDGRSADDAFREGPMVQDANTGLFSRVKALGSTTHIFFGHDHKNILNYQYQGVSFVYGLKTGYCAYYDKDRVGAVLVTLDDTGSITGVSFHHL
jgi:hypothetical protein